MPRQTTYYAPVCVTTHHVGLSTTTLPNPNQHVYRPTFSSRTTPPPPFIARVLRRAHPNAVDHLCSVAYHMNPMPLGAQIARAKRDSFTPPQTRRPQKQNKIFTVATLRSEQTQLFQRPIDFHRRHLSWQFHARRRIFTNTPIRYRNIQHLRQNIMRGPHPRR